MPVLDLDGLTRYDGKLKDYIGRFANWQKTSKAGAVSFYPVGNSPLETSVDFLFSETGPASGDKGPENPSTISGVTQIVLAHCGKNLYTCSGNKTVNGITFTDNGDGSITANGTATVTATYRLSINPNASFWLKSGIPYYLSGCPSGGSSSTYYVAQYNGVGRDIGNGLAILLNESKASAADIVIYTGYTASNLTFWPQLELGISATSFEKGSTTNYTIPLNNTYYGGTLDVASGVMTVTMQYMVADSNADIVWIGTNFVAWRYPAGLNCIGRAVGTEVCSHFPFNGAWDGSFAHFYATPSSGLYFANPNWTASTYRQYFTDQYNNGTPVTACYQLATPLTVQLTPTQILSLSQADPYIPRLNTVYSDQESVQVGYIKSPIRTEYELTQAIIATEGGE